MKNIDSKMNIKSEFVRIHFFSYNTLKVTLLLK